MGNSIFSECKNNLIQTPTQLMLKPNIQSFQIKDNKNQHLKNSSNKKTNQHKRLQFFDQIPSRSKVINEIYLNLIKQKPLQYSIENPAFLHHYYGVNSLKSIQKILTQSQNRSNNQHKSIKQQSSSTTQSESQQGQRKKNNIQIIKFKFESINDFIEEYSVTNSRRFIYGRQSFQKKSYQMQSIYSQDLLDISQQIDQKIFDIFQDQYIYVGFLQNDLPHGPGQLYQLKNNQKQAHNCQSNKFIQAQFVNGVIQTNDCILILEEGHYYRGGFAKNNLNGKGFLKLGNGFQLNGTFREGILQGKGKAVYTDGGCFEGFFRNGKRQGKGKMYWRSSNVQIKSINKDEEKEIYFQGYFKDDKMNGLGYLRTPNYEYWGPFMNNMKQGKGTIKFRDGKKFQGWFEKDQINGYGELHHPDGKVEKGIFPINY